MSPYIWMGQVRRWPLWPRVQRVHFADINEEKKVLRGKYEAAEERFLPGRLGGQLSGVEGLIERRQSRSSWMMNHDDEDNDDDDDDDDDDDNDDDDDDDESHFFDDGNAIDEKLYGWRGWRWRLWTICLSLRLETHHVSKCETEFKLIESLQHSMVRIYFKKIFLKLHLIRIGICEWIRLNLQNKIEITCFGMISIIFVEIQYFFQKAIAIHHY